VRLVLRLLRYFCGFFLTTPSTVHLVSGSGNRVIRLRVLFLLDFFRATV
jgi:hypothetical protein